MRTDRRRFLTGSLGVLGGFATWGTASPAMQGAGGGVEVATFVADITPPLGEPLNFAFSPPRRPELVDRVYDGMVRSTKKIDIEPVSAIEWTTAEVPFPLRTDGSFSAGASRKMLGNPKASVKGGYEHTESFIAPSEKLLKEAIRTLLAGNA